jgi:hypothetical protein
MKCSRIRKNSAVQRVLRLNSCEFSYPKILGAFQLHEESIFLAVKAA